MSRAGVLRIRPFVGDGSILLAIDLDQSFTLHLAGFSIRCTYPDGSTKLLRNRLNFGTLVTSQTTPEQREWTDSDVAPFQKFRWVHYPERPGSYHYEVTARYFEGTTLTDGAVASADAKLDPATHEHFRIGFTKAYLSSQAYAERFGNTAIRPPGAKAIDFDTGPFEAQYQWLGSTARTMLFEFLDECLAHDDFTVDVYAYDLDEPDFIRRLTQLGPRLRAVLDNASLHTDPGDPEVAALAALRASAGEGNVVAGKFKRFAHNKVLIQKRNGIPTKVLMGSANFSIRGLYVQANNILVFDNEDVAARYEEAFDTGFQHMSTFASFPIAKEWFPIAGEGIPSGAVAFSPHATPSVSLDRVAEAIGKAKSSVLFAVMELGGGGDVLSQLRNLGDRADLFSYGITQSDKGLSLFKPGSTNGIFTTFDYLKDKVPAPFRQEFGGGVGQVIHHKFVVVDFNDEIPLLFTGSSNLAEGGEEENGDNLLEIRDREVVAAYAVEAIRLVDHYHFRAAMSEATDVQPLRLQGPDETPHWWEPYFDTADVKCRDRALFTW
jgi:hypothetical protein